MQSQNSENDQPNNNGPNACLKGYYNKAKEIWDERFGTTRYNAPHFNSVMVQAWGEFTLSAPPIIKRAFEKTRLHPLRPPSSCNNIAVGTCTAAMQCASGKKAVELGVFQKDALKVSNFNVTKPNPDEIVVLRPSNNNTSRNLLIRSVAYDILNQMLLLPSQEIKRINQEHIDAKSVKVGPSTVLEQSRMNPDTSYGAHVTAEVRARARAVQKAKLAKQQQREASKTINAKKIAEQAKKKQSAYNRVVASIKTTRAIDLRTRLSTNTSDNLKLTYIYIGGVLARLPDLKKATLVIALSEHEKITAIDVSFNNESSTTMIDISDNNKNDCFVLLHAAI